MGKSKGKDWITRVNEALDIEASDRGMVEDLFIWLQQTGHGDAFARWYVERCKKGEHTP